MLLNLLSASSDVSANDGNQWGTLIMMGVLLIIVIAFSIYNRRTQKKRQEETQKQLDAIKPGTKVKTIGGICGTVVELCDDNAFILETGSKKSGKSYIKFDKQAVYQSDAVVEETKKEEVKDVVEKPVQEKTEESETQE
ncbi:MAG: preprotein translocase subunit YajC [Clostridiales bacterium]|nr:preprotein translocase subunit YajC [Clostridiales bacterium]